MRLWHFQVDVSNVEPAELPLCYLLQRLMEVFPFHLELWFPCHHRVFVGSSGRKSSSKRLRCSAAVLLKRLGYDCLALWLDSSECCVCTFVRLRKRPRLSGPRHVHKSHALPCCYLASLLAASLVNGAVKFSCYSSCGSFLDPREFLGYPKGRADLLGMSQCGHFVGSRLAAHDSTAILETVSRFSLPNPWFSDLAGVPC
jgi:hypothetical protein